MFSQRSWFIFLATFAVVTLLAGDSLGRESETHMVTMRDGVRLATDVHFPQGEGPWPTILYRTPYGRAALPDLTQRGYVVVAQHMRGYGGSEGQKASFETDGWGILQDGYDTLAWVANQPWCSGKIGTWGGSALGITQNLLAGSHPPDLLCQHILAGASDLYSQMFFQGGVFRQSMIEGWWSQHGRQEHLVDLLAHPSYDDRWALLNADTRAEGMTYAAMHVGGWYDIFLQGTLNAFMERQHNGGHGSAENQKLVMGPWWHGGFGTTSQGDISYPPNSVYHELWADSYSMYDYYLKGVDNGWTSLPNVRYYVMGDVDDPLAPGNVWRAADDWPPPYTNLSLYLGQGSLDLRPGSAGTMSYSYDPANPTPTVGGANLMIPGGPKDQALVEQRDDVLVFSTPPLEVPVEVTGRIRVQLYASSSCLDTDFMARLSDVYPDGRSMLVLDGAVKARHRDSLKVEELMVPGEVYEFWIDLWSTSIVFNKGHRIRLSISSSNYPRFEANPNTGDPYRSSERTLVANNSVHFGSSHPSRLLLPLTGPDSDGDGIYDLDDPFPDAPGPQTSVTEMTAILDGTESRVAQVMDEGLRSVLQIGLGTARARLEVGDVGGTGHLLRIIESCLPFDPGNITKSDAREVMDAALREAMAAAREGSFPSMHDCVVGGWQLAVLTEQLPSDPGYPILLDLLREAQDVMAAEGCRDSLLLVEWLAWDDVRSMASRIQLAGEGGAPETQLLPIEGMLRSSREQYLDRRPDSARLMIQSAEGRLDRLSIYIDEPAAALLIPLVSALSIWPVSAASSRMQGRQERAMKRTPTIIVEAAKNLT